MRRALPLALLAVIAAGCGGAQSPRAVHGQFAAVRPPDAHTSMDTNPANLASAVVTHAFGQLPEYIDSANFRLLPFDMYATFDAGRTVTRTYRITTPRTGLVLDTVAASGLTQNEAHQNAVPFSVSVTLDGRRVPRIERYWVAYRNNGPLICRIYFPGDLSSQNMDVHSLVLRPLSPGRHRISVTVVRRSPGVPTARRVTTYALRVLDRAPNKAERAIAPEEDGPKPPSGTPLTFLDHRR